MARIAISVAIPGLITFSSYLLSSLWLSFPFPFLLQFLPAIFDLPSSIKFGGTSITWIKYYYCCKQHVYMYIYINMLLIMDNISLI